MLRHITVVVLIVAAALVPAAAFCADMEGKIQSVNDAERTITLENGVTIWLGDGVPVDAVKQGAEVKVMYEDKDGKPVATSVEIK